MTRNDEELLIFVFAFIVGVTTPSDTNQQLHDIHKHIVKKFPVGNYILTIGTRPDITHAVGVASRFLEKPTIVH